MAIKKSDLIELLVDLISDKEEEQSEVQEDPKPKKKAKPKAPPVEDNDDEEEEEVEEVEEKPKSKKKEDNDDDVVKALQDRVAKQARETAESTIRASLKSSKLDDDHFDSINEFIEYGKLINENGEVDKEAVKELTDSLTSIALRTPPKSKNSLDDLNSKSSGLSKYLT